MLYSFGWLFNLVDENKKSRWQNFACMRQAVLILETGQTYRGIGFGASGASYGELVFNTSMTGYVESLTDPS